MTTGRRGCKQAQSTATFQSRRWGLSRFGGLLALKLRVRRYAPWPYWAVFTASAILGTALSDFIDRTLGLGYALGSAMLSALLLATLAVWRTTQGSLAVERIETTGAELCIGSRF